VCLDFCIHVLRWNLEPRSSTRILVLANICAWFPCSCCWISDPLFISRQKRLRHWSTCSFDIPVRVARNLSMCFRRKSTDASGIATVTWLHSWHVSAFLGNIKHLSLKEKTHMPSGNQTWQWASLINGGVLAGTITYKLILDYPAGHVWWHQTVFKKQSNPITSTNSPSAVSSGHENLLGTHLEQSFTMVFK